jgi:hypothetical protein
MRAGRPRLKEKTMLRLARSIGIVLVALAARVEVSRVGAAQPAVTAASNANRPVVRGQSNGASDRRGGYVVVYPDGTYATVGPRCISRAFPTWHYPANYGELHGWGFPGGRWDPSLPRD